jgi:hypothetical protein
MAILVDGPELDRLEAIRSAAEAETGGATFARLKMLLENIQIDKEISNTTVKVFKELRSRGDGA